MVSAGGGAALAADKETIATWLKQDGRVLALGLDSAEANRFLPVKMRNQVGRAHWHILRTSRGEIAAGRRRPGGCPQPRSAGRPAGHGRAQTVGDGVLATALEGRVVFCQIAPWQFDIKQQNTKRTFRRTSCLLSRLLGNLGVHGQTPLLERFATPIKLTDGQSPECRWLKGFYLDQPEEWDDPYRFFGW